MKLTYVFLLIGATAYFFRPDSVAETHHPYAVNERISMENIGSHVPPQDHGPKVDIAIPGTPQYFAWDTQFRYVISVADPVDGESRYGEIDARSCVMEIEYFTSENELEQQKVIPTKEEHKGLSLLRRSTCFGCHADKSRLVGPSFAEIAERYENNPATIHELANHVIDGSTGIWGTQIMPAHPDLSSEQAAEILDFILTQGGNKNRWVYPGLEGTFRTIEKENNEHGAYVLTASYVSTSNMRGERSLVFKVK